MKALEPGRFLAILTGELLAVAAWYLWLDVTSWNILFGWLVINVLAAFVGVLGVLVDRFTNRAAASS